MSEFYPTISRRDMMKGTLASAALTGLTLPGRAQEKKPASERLTLGFIGMGFQMQAHLNHFLGQKDVQVLAVCDVDTSRRENAKKKVEAFYGRDTKNGVYKGCTAHVDFHEVINRKDIDAVVIATPDHWHTIPAIEACKAGKDIYCEKPLSLTIHEAKVLVDAVRKHQRVFQTGSQQRSEAGFRIACELVRSGRIGKIQRLYVRVGGPSKPCDLPGEKAEPGLDWDRWLGPAPERAYNSILSPRGVHGHYPAWRSYQEYSGGAMTDFGAHHFDIAQWGLGMDESGPVEIIPPEDPKAVQGLKYVYANGIEVIQTDTDDQGRKVPAVTFVGTEGRIYVDRGYLASSPAEIIKVPLGEKDVRLAQSPGHQRDWLDCVKSRKKPICDVEIGARSVTVCHLGNLAYWNHRKLKWNPKEWRFVDDKEADKWLDRERRKGYELPSIG